MIKSEEVAKLAELARLGVSEDELQSVGRDLSAILDYVSELAKATSGSGLTFPGADRVKAESLVAGALVNVWREDGEPYPPGAYSKQLLAVAPATQDGYFKVKKIL